MARYSKSASDDVKGATKRRKAGTLKGGGSGKTVKSKKQAIAIGLSGLARKARRFRARNPPEAFLTRRRRSSSKISSVWPRRLRAGRSPHVQDDGLAVSERNCLARTMREHRPGERRYIGDRAARGIGLVFTHNLETLLAARRLCAR